MVPSGISFGHAAEHSPMFVHEPKPSCSIASTIAMTRRVSLGLALRQKPQVGDLGGGEQHRRRVRARGDARATTDARGRLERFVGVGFRHRDRMRLRARRRCLPRCSRQPAMMRSNAPRSTTRSFSTGNARARHGSIQTSCPSLKLPHVQLTCGGGALRSVGNAVDNEPAHAADAFAAVVVEGDRIFAVGDEPFVHDVEHFEERHVLADVVGRIRHASARAHRRSPAATRAESDSLVAPLRGVDVVEGELLFVQHRAERRRRRTPTRRRS